MRRLVQKRWRRDIVAHCLNILCNLVKFAALLVRVKVGLAVKVGVVDVLVEHRGDVGLAHELEAEGFEAVVDVHAAKDGVVPEEGRVEIAPVLVKELQGPAVLADEVLP